MVVVAEARVQWGAASLLGWWCHANQLLWSETKAPTGKRIEWAL